MTRNSLNNEMGKEYFWTPLKMALHPTIAFSNFYKLWVKCTLAGHADLQARYIVAPRGAQGCSF